MQLTWLYFNYFVKCQISLFHYVSVDLGTLWVLTSFLLLRRDITGCLHQVAYMYRQFSWILHCSYYSLLFVANR